MLADCKGIRISNYNLDISNEMKYDKNISWAIFSQFQMFVKSLVRSQFIYKIIHINMMITKVL